MKKFCLLFIAFAVSCFAFAVRPSSSYAPIRNDCFWQTVDGEPLYSQGGGIFRFADPRTGEPRYFWYGVRYAEADTYRRDPSVTLEANHFEGVACYSSDDLSHWKFETDVLTREEVESHARPTWVGRMGVAHLPEIERYAMFIQHGSRVLVALADNPLGPFAWDHEIDMTSRIGTSNTGDQTVFTDEDTGRSYLIYSYGRGRNRIYVSEIGVRDGQVDLLDCTEVFHGASREGNCLFKYKGRFFMCASNIYGWDSSYAYYLVADDIRGPYRPMNDMQVMAGCESDYAHVSQTGFFYTVRGSEQETVVFCGDRWAEFAGNGLGYNQWCPISFDDNGLPHFRSLSAWSLDVRTGRWRVDSENNYVLNGSFEADRRPVPNPVKPVQDYLTGWHTEVERGRAVIVGDLLSPQLNYLNTHEDRRYVIGEKSLRMEDAVSFRRRVSQQVGSTSSVALPDGRYALRAMVRVRGRFARLEMYASCNSGRRTADLSALPDAWSEVLIEDIPVSGGAAEVGFIADGEGGACCLVDDVRFVQVRASGE